MTEFYTKEQTDNLAVEIGENIRQSTSATRIKNIIEDMGVAKAASDLDLEAFVAHLDEGYTGIINEFKKTTPKLIMSFSKMERVPFNNAIEINGVMYNEDRAIDLASYSHPGGDISGLGQLDLNYDLNTHSLAFKNKTNNTLEIKIYTANENFFASTPGSDTTASWDIVFKLKTNQNNFGGGFI